ncbi:hypothetical protein BAUCODRAFT_536846 [Baudoinia panamericana UAMH 10762]|uniref:Rgp1-domain-containing protein n=1 Tax=Baudoinia panamericana (strain UAMH 10762) TaxID=717646 RepID=M2MUT9_BAUPA|nr:uncharacterized protein BAUCODRAFT_536846 [Baudoinia panamericana UAMH 10762]EMC95343.1 hypothetical protein BAUCODRAFT_536846 [Baudoinia panamericana UAMH 10762]
MPPTSTSNIRAYVQWRAPSVYAGEEIECIITFRNVASLEDEAEEDVRTPLANGSAHSRAPSYTASTLPSRRTSIAQSRPPISRGASTIPPRAVTGGKGHRPTLSLNVVSAPGRGGQRSAPLPSRTPASAVRGHGRSLSIMSLATDVAAGAKVPSPSVPRARPAKGHGRSASLQVIPRQPPSPANATLGLGIGTPRQPSPLYESTTPTALQGAQGEPLPIRPSRRRPGTVSAGNTPQLGRQEALRSTVPEGHFDANFQFPAKTLPGVKSPSPQSERPKPVRNPSNLRSTQQRAISPRPLEHLQAVSNNLNPISRVMSESSFGDTPRSSAEFYSMSNHSDETLTSEAPQHDVPIGRLLPKPGLSRQASRLRQSSYGEHVRPETLMMASVQTVGSFTLDGSLVNAAPFEEVKRKGVQSGGGVVGIERSKRSSGMFGAFSWGNIGESLSGLLGGDEMSTMAQMKAEAGSKSVPLLSTPQSLLFVNVTLAPGESRSYSYRFALPRGLPPSHRGRAMKVNYHLSIGVQRPDGQTVKHVEVPFRVLGSYNTRGETLGHDLMSPYILLQDPARTTSITPDPNLSPSDFPPFPDKEAQKQVITPKQGLEDFLRYTERLLAQRKDSNGALLSPTSPLASPSLSRQQSPADQAPVSVKEAIDMAILRSNHVNTPEGKQKQPEAQSANRFNIARSGQPVAVLTILRPAYRLGEAVLGTIDFAIPTPSAANAPSSISTYAVRIELESAERVDSSLALRSPSSIHRVTRRVHASVYENTLFARQASFNLTVPLTATPTFETTGVSLGWRLRIEFVAQRQQQRSPQQPSESGERILRDEQLLEELGSDERGTVLIARETVAAETFEIAVPLIVFGSPGVEGPGAVSDALEV